VVDDDDDEGELDLESEDELDHISTISTSVCKVSGLPSGTSKLPGAYDSPATS